MRNLGLLAAMMFASIAAAQSRPLTLLKNIDGANAIAVGVLWSHGYDDDSAVECGLARVLAKCRLERAQRAVPGCLASGLHVGADYGLAFAVVGRADQKRALLFLKALIDEGSGEQWSDDQLALIVARIALAADDAEFLYPGSALLSRARKHLGRGTAIARPPVGIASAIAKLTPSRVREALRLPVPMCVACLGVIDADFAKSVEALPIPRLELSVRGAQACVEVSAGSGVSEVENDRADSPYVSVAFAVPPGRDRAAFALGIEVATARAFRRWRYRGLEQWARAPFVAWSWLHADALVQFSRRGEDPRQLLPGERPEAKASDEVRATKAELEMFLDDLRTVPPSKRELEIARNALRSRWRFAEAGEVSAWASEPATYPGRLQVLLLAAHHGVDVARLDTLTTDSVHAALKRVLQSERGSWHALLPASSLSYGYRRR